MDYLHFSERLPSLFDNWDTLRVRPYSTRFKQILERVRGMTSANVLQLLNFAVSCMEDGEAYFEVGCFQGATLIGALLDHPTVFAHAVDDFSEFDLYGDNQTRLMQNLNAFGLAHQVKFRNQNFEECLIELRLQKPKLGVYLYDGSHDYRSQLLGLLLAAPLLADRALIVIDDANFPAVKQATYDFLAICPAVRLLLDLPTPGNCHSTFWNGIFVLAWDAHTISQYDWPFFQRGRQVDLLESLDVLQLVNLKKRDGLISMIKVD